MPVLEEFIIKTIIQGAIRAEEAQTGGETGRLSTAVSQRAAAQVASGTAIPIPPSVLEEFAASFAPFPLTGRARQFAFIGEGTTLSREQLTILGVFPRAVPIIQFSPHFSFIPSSRVPSLARFVSSHADRPSLTDRLRLEKQELRAS